MAQTSSPGRIVVIDDDEMSRELLVMLLEAEGYSVASAESGDAALTLLQSRPRPDLVLTDMQMPGSTPIQLAGRLRRACGRSTLLLAMSGSHPAPATLTRYDGFLLKPFSTADLISAIKNAGAAHPSSRITTRSAILSLAAAAEPASKNKMGSTSPLAAGHAEPAAILDETIYGQLAGSMPASQLREVYSMCLSDARMRIDSMRSLAAAQDDAQFMRQAHTIKGSCGMLGATELHRLAAALESNGLQPAGSGSNSPAVAVNSLDELSHACDRLERMLSARA